jgi:UDP-glucose 4-epimerase
VEKYLYYFSLQYPLRYVILRYANVYGPRQNPHGEAGVVAIFSNKLLSGEQPLIHGDGKQTRDYVFVDDVVHANLLGLEYPENEIFNVGTGIETDVNTLFELLNKYTAGKAVEKHGPPMPGEQRRSVISSDKALKLLKWKPGFPLEKGIQKTLDYFRKVVKQ